MMNKNLFLEHKYGDNFLISSSPYVHSLLAKFSSPEVKQPFINQYLNEIYSMLLAQTVTMLFPTEESTVETRMKEFVAEGEFKGLTIPAKQKAVIVSLARAGIVPSQMCFEKLHMLLNPEGIRQDHFYINRKTNENDEVVGVDVSGSKIGGDIDEAIVLLPDPMGATGGSISYVIDYYKNKVEGTAFKFIAMHLMITPEYIQKLKEEHPDVYVIAGRLDRGLSDKKALSATPGEYPSLERGLTDKQYIVPGAGGVGEILNNSFV